MGAAAWPLKSRCALTGRTRSVVEGVVADGRRAAQSLQVQMPDESDDRANEHLDTADDEQPCSGGHEGVGEEHETADEEPQSDEHIIGDADDL